LVVSFLVVLVLFVFPMVLCVMFQETFFLPFAYLFGSVSTEVPIHGSLTVAVNVTLAASGTFSSPVLTFAALCHQGRTKRTESQN